MNVPSEKHIEQYILNRSELTDDEQQWVREWIQKDEKVRCLADWFETFYKEVDEIESIHERPGTFSPVIELESVHEKSNYSGGVFVLAAQTPVVNRRKKGLTTIRTFVSQKHKTLIRILHDSSKNQSKLHVISESVGENDIVLIEIRDQANTTLVSEPGGTFVIPNEKFSEEIIKSWTKCELHLPISIIKVFKDDVQETLNFDTSEAQVEREEFSLNKQGDELQIRFNRADKIVPDKMVIYDGEKSLIWPVEDGRCSIKIQDISDSASTLFFYN